MRTINRLAAIAAGLLVAGQASAATMTFERSESTSGWLTAQLAGTNVNGIAYVLAGRFEWQVTAASADAPYSVGDTVYTFCTEVNEFAAPTQVFEQTGLENLPSSGPQMTALRQSRLDALYSNYYSGSETVNGSSESYDLGSLTGGSAIIEAAFQFAVWEIVYGDDLNVVQNQVVADGFYVKNVNLGVPTAARTQAVNIANSWLTGLDSLTGGAALTGLLSIDPVSGQDMLVVVPLPAAAVLGLAGLALAGRARRHAIRIA